MIEGLLGPVDALLNGLFALDPWLVYVLTAVFTALETTALIGLVAPGDVVVLLAGSTVTGPATYATVALAAAGGSLAGETGGYLLGRLVGPRLRHSRLGRRLGEDRWARAEAYLHGRGGPALAAARFVAVLHAVVPLVAGAVRMPYRTFAGWSALGALAWSATFTGVGMLAGSAYRQYGHLGLLATAALVAAAGLGGLARHAHRRRRWQPGRRSGGASGRPAALPGGGAPPRRRGRPERRRVPGTEDHANTGIQAGADERDSARR